MGVRRAAGTDPALRVRRTSRAVRPRSHAVRSGVVTVRPCSVHDVPLREHPLAALCLQACRVSCALAAKERLNGGGIRGSVVIRGSRSMPWSHRGLVAVGDQQHAETTTSFEGSQRGTRSCSVPARRRHTPCPTTVGPRPRATRSLRTRRDTPSASETDSVKGALSGSGQSLPRSTVPGVIHVFMPGTLPGCTLPGSSEDERAAIHRPEVTDQLFLGGQNDGSARSWGPN